MDRKARAAFAIAATLLALTGCGKPKAAEWMQITQGDPCASASESPCEGARFYLDTANISTNAGTPYIILQTRYADGRVGSIRAEVNCPRRMIEPTALKEALSKDGVLVENRTTNLSADDEKALLDYACKKR
jgi:hypothetical protein